MLQPRIARLCSARCLPLWTPAALRVSSNAPARTTHTQARPCNAVIRQTAVAVDEDGIPVAPPYSIDTFLSELPAPSVSDEQFLHLHKLAALIPPEPGSPEFAEKKQALEDMVRIVEGVRPDVQGNGTIKLDTSLPDGRIWPQDEGIHVDWESIAKPARSGRQHAATLPEGQQKDHGKVLLKLAEKQVAGYYVVKKRPNVDVE